MSSDVSSRDGAAKAKRDRTIERWFLEYLLTLQQPLSLINSIFPGGSHWLVAENDSLMTARAQLSGIAGHLTELQNTTEESAGLNKAIAELTSHRPLFSDAQLYYSLLHELKYLQVMNQFRAQEVRLSRLDAAVTRQFPAAGPQPPVAAQDAASPAAAAYADQHVRARELFAGAVARARQARGEDRGRLLSEFEDAQPSQSADVRRVLELVQRTMALFPPALISRLHADVVAGRYIPALQHIDLGRPLTRADILGCFRGNEAVWGAIERETEPEVVRFLSNPNVTLRGPRASAVEPIVAAPPAEAPAPAPARVRRVAAAAASAADAASASESSKAIKHKSQPSGSPTPVRAYSAASRSPRPVTRTATEFYVVDKQAVARAQQADVDLTSPRTAGAIDALRSASNTLKHHGADPLPLALAKARQVAGEKSAAEELWEDSSGSRPKTARKRVAPPAKAAAATSDAFEFAESDGSQKSKRSQPPSKMAKSPSKKKQDDDEHEPEEAEEAAEEEADEGDEDRSAARKFFSLKQTSQQRRRQERALNEQASRVRVRWSPEETEALIEGVRLFGSSANWSTILHKFNHVFVQRLPGDLKDKWRNLNKNK